MWVSVHVGVCMWVWVHSLGTMDPLSSRSQDMSMETHSTCGHERHKCDMWAWGVVDTRMCYSMCITA